MAGEYSRELSVRVFIGQSQIARKGYVMGGSAPYGLRRLLVDQNDKPKCILAYGEQKSITTDRVLLVPGPPNEIATVRAMFSMFVCQRLRERRIAAILNERGLVNGFGRSWRFGAVRRILSDEKYVGNYVWNRYSGKLQSPLRRNDPALWVRANGAVPAIIDSDLFEAAQSILEARSVTTIAGRPQGLSSDQMLERLKDLYKRHGYLNRALIDSDRDLPAADAYFRRFGGLRPAFDLIGVRHRHKRGFCRSGRPCGLSNDEMLAVLQRLLEEHGYLTEEVIRASENAAHPSAYFTRFGSLRRAYQLIGYVPDRERTRPPRIARGLSNEVLLEILRGLLRRYGRLSKSIIDGSGVGFSPDTIAYRFGGLLRAYKLIGYTSNWYGERHVRPYGLPDEEMLNGLRTLWREHGLLSQKLIRKVKSVPSYYEYCKRFGSLSEAYKLIGFR